MMKQALSILALAGMLATPPLFAASAAKPRVARPSVPPQPLPARVRLAFQTSAGPFAVELDREKAPLTTANFLRYVDAKRFDGAEFFRAMAWGPQDQGRAGLIQGKARWDGRNIIPPVAHEPTSKTGIVHLDGTLSMARGAPGTATSDFFITIGPMPSLDADPKAPGDNLGYAAFGRVVEGMDVIRAIHTGKIDPGAGQGFMKGQILAQPVRIISVRRVALPPQPASAAPPINPPAAKTAAQ